MSKVYHFRRTQFIPTSLSTAWNFFSDPANLQEITPGHLKFTVISQPEHTMYPGQLIEYTIKPFLGIPVYWMTEITHVEEKKYFVDEQRFGPYRLWHHLHHFKEVEAGVEMTDTIHYKIPYFFIGDIANAVFVKNRLKQIFDFRSEVIAKKFSNLNP